MKRVFIVLLTVLMLFSSTATMKVISAEDDVTVDQETETVETVSDFEETSSDEATEEEIIETETPEVVLVEDEVASTEETDPLYEEEFPKTEESLIQDGSDHLTEQTASLQGTAYAVLTSNGDLIFFRSFETYTNRTSATVKDIYNNAYTGTVYTEIETSHHIWSDVGNLPWYPNRASVKKVYVAPDQIIKPISVACWFCDCLNLTSFNLTGFDTSDLTYAFRMFQGCSSLSSVDLRGLDVSHCEYIYAMFYGCSSLTSVDLSSFDTSNATNISGMFQGCSSLTTVDLNSFDTSNVITMHDMFQDCSSLTSLDLSNFNTSKVTNMGKMFYGCSSLTELDISSFDTSSVRYNADEMPNYDTSGMLNMFYGCSSLATVKLGSGFTNWINNACLPKGNWYNEDINLSKSEIELYSEYPSNASSWSGTWTNITPGTAYAVLTSNGDLIFFRSFNSYTNGASTTVTDVYGNTYSGIVYTGIETSSYTIESMPPWYYSKKESIKKAYVAPDQIIMPISTADWFYECSNLTSFDGTGLDTSKSTRMLRMFQGCSSLTYVDLNGFDTSNCEEMWHMFEGCSSLTSIDLSSFDISKVHYLSGLFRYCSSLTSVDLSSFDTSNVTMMHIMFEGCSSLTSLDLSNFDTSNVNNMGMMFYGCSSLTELNISSFDTGNVVYNADDVPYTYAASGMDKMFYGCENLQRVVLGDKFTKWINQTYLPKGIWVNINNGIYKTETELYSEYPSNASDWAGEWKKSNLSNFGDIIPGDIPEFITLNMPEGIWLSAIDDVTFDPLNKTYIPSFRVYDHTTMLHEGTDYKVSFKNNSKAGTASVTVTGKGDYTGTYVKTFNILPKEFDDEFKVVLSKDAFAYTGKALKPTVSSVEYGGIKLKNKTDYAVSYENAGSANEGTYKVFITGKGNYRCTLEAEYVISKTLRPVSLFKVSGIKSKAYTGEEVFQDIIVKDGKTTLVLDRDYSLDYEDNTEAGTAYVTIEGKGIYTGSLVRSFKITPIRLTKSSVLIQDLPSSQPYDGKAHEPETVLRYDGRELIKDRDYTVSYKNNVNAGTATITYKGKGNYSGSLTASFAISKLSIAEDDVSLSDSYPYEKGGAAPLPKIKVNDLELTGGKDFTVSYKNNTSLGDASITIKAKGNYEGTVTLPFKVTSKSLIDVDMEVQDKAYSTKAKAWKSVPVLTDTNGKKLKAGTDYDKAISYTYHDTVSVMDGSVKSKPIVTRNEGEPVRDNDILMADTLVDVSVTGRGNYTGTLSKTYRIAKTSLAKAKVTIPVQYYTGKDIEPGYEDIKVTLNGEMLVGSQDYEILSYANNIKKGSASMTIRGIGKYGGIKTIKFTIKQRSLGITIKFNPNGATSGNMKDQMIYKDTKLIKNTFKRTGYTFKGFNTKWDCSGDWYYPGGTFPYDPEKAGTFVMLYAIWK